MTAWASPSAIDALAERLQPQYPSNCSIAYGGTRTVQAYCRYADSSDGYRVWARVQTWQGVVSKAGSWATAGDMDGSNLTVPSGQNILRSSAWIEKKDCCFHSF